MNPCPGPHNASCQCAGGGAPQESSSSDEHSSDDESALAAQQMQHVQGAGAPDPSAPLRDPDVISVLVNLQSRLDMTSAEAVSSVFIGDHMRDIFVSLQNLVLMLLAMGAEGEPIREQIECFLATPMVELPAQANGESQTVAQVMALEGIPPEEWPESTIIEVWELLQGLLETIQNPFASDN